MKNLQENLQYIDDYDKEFIQLLTGKLKYFLYFALYILDIDNLSQEVNKHTRLRIESWCKKLCQITNNYEWRKNRNLHAICLLDNILNDRYEEPYNKFPTEGSIPLLSKSVVISKLSKKFWEYTKNLKQFNGISQRPQKSFHEQTLPMNENLYEDSLFNNNICYIKKERPKSSKKLNINKRKNYINDNNYEIEELKRTVLNLQNEINRQNFIINKQRNEKMQLIKRIENLENIMATFC